MSYRCNNDLALSLYIVEQVKIICYPFLSGVMPRSRVPQRQSPLGGAPNLRTSSSDSDHHRPRTERSPKLSDGRSPRVAQSDPLNKKKLGTRIADLESQLGQAQGELKSLKDQLASAQQQLEKKKSKKQQNPEPLETQEKHSTTVEMNQKEGDSSIVFETFDDDVDKETDVFEVPIERVTVEPKSTVSSFDELAFKKDEINLLMNKLDDEGKELEVIRQENENLKSQLNEKLIKLSSAQSEIKEMNEKLDKADQELEKSRTSVAQINEKLDASEKAKEELENEMKRLRVQSEQWRKAADAAASILAGGVEMNGRMISERCGSMDKHYGNNVFEARGSGYRGYVGSPGMTDDSDDVFEGGKKKGSSGIRMFGDLWKRKGQK
ncbi:hypothetical protein BUALT_Bualt18G0035200 [Buddleja alternifolia]|uniref:Interactor of constitutive active ROPs 4 n=1 Tax=Buddleja alternifolia TaxID=168488 RepID=A0AAV6W475_9LAMI|nr:hypothetical protein BUALT_Bualt18G0035200 [Buddleja alternifolia]